MLSEIGESRYIFPAAFGPTAILSMYMSGNDNNPPSGAAAMTEIAFSKPFATLSVHSNGSTAIYKGYFKVKAIFDEE